jgi:hypothetical protein
MPGVGSNITDTTRFARTFGIRTPSGVIPFLQLNSFGQPALTILYINTTNLTQFSCGDTRFHVFNGRITRIHMRKGKNQARFFYFFL